MKKFLITFLMLIASTFVFAEGNWWEQESPEQPVKTTETTESVLTAGPEANNNFYYVLTLEVRQTHISLDFTEHLKDMANRLTIEIPVDKDYYDSCFIGKDIAKEFRIGSLLAKGSFGNLRIRVIDKKTVRK